MARIHEAVRTLREEFGVAVLVMTRTDCADRLGRDLTEVEWRRITATAAWRDGLCTESVMDAAWAWVDEALAEAQIDDCQR